MTHNTSDIWSLYTDCHRTRICIYRIHNIWNQDNRYRLYKHRVCRVLNLENYRLKSMLRHIPTGNIRPKHMKLPYNNNNNRLQFLCWRHLHKLDISCLCTDYRNMFYICKIRIYIFSRWNNRYLVRISFCRVLNLENYWLKSMIRHIPTDNIHPKHMKLPYTRKNNRYHS